MQIDYDMEFISLRDFLELPFLCTYTECIVRDENGDKILIDAITIKDLKIEIADGMYKELVEDYYVEYLMPSLIVRGNDTGEYIFDIGLKRF